MALAPRPPPQRPHFLAPPPPVAISLVARPPRPADSSAILPPAPPRRRRLRRRSPYLARPRPRCSPPPRPHRPQPSLSVAVCLAAAALLHLRPRPAVVCLLVAVRWLAALTSLRTHLLRRPRRRVAASSNPLSSAPRLSLAGWLRPARATQHHASPTLRLRRLAASVLLPRRVELAVPLALHRLEADSAPHRHHSEGPPLLRQHLEQALCQPSVRSRCRKSVPQPPLARRWRSVV